MNKTWIIAAVLGLLVVISMVQIVQLNGLKGKISGAATTTVSAQNSGGETVDEMNARMHPDQVQKSSASTPKSLENLPSMVGGC